MPYHVFGARSGAAAETIAWICSAIVRSDFGISWIFSSRSLSPASLLFCAFSSRARSFIAERSSAENVELFVPFVADFFSAISDTSSSNETRPRSGPQGGCPSHGRY
jgi:hypothetical protein